MSEFEQSSRGASGSGVAELQEELNGLRMMLSVSLVLLLLFGAVFDFFLLKQVSTLREQTAIIKLSEQGFNFNGPKAIDYWNHLVAYSRQHPEFAPIINKYSPALNETLLGSAPPLK
jgi:hypothetical protein